MFHVTNLGSTTVKHVPNEMILSGSTASTDPSCRSASASTAVIVAIKPPGSPTKDVFNAETSMVFLCKTSLLSFSRLMRDAVLELMAGSNATMYWLAFSPLPVDDLMTQSSSSELLLFESLFFLQETMKNTIPKRKIDFCMCVMFFLANAITFADIDFCKRL